MKGKMKKILSICMIITCMLSTMGLSWSNGEMFMDTEVRPVYQNEDSEYFLIRSGASPDAAKEMYNNQYVLMLGKVKAIDGNKKIRIGMISEHSRVTLTCSTNREDVIGAISNLHVGDFVKVYGQLKVGMLDGKWSMTIDKIETTYEKEISRTAFSVISGKTLDREKMEVRTLNHNQITYYVPKEWTSVETSIKDNIGRVEGYQYRLNEINKEAVQPESLFVFYFDNEALMSSNDKSKTDQIERTIVNNLLNDDPGKADKSIKTYYGATYHYYQTAYKSTLGKNFHAEFIFQPMDKDGFIVYMYLFQEKSHIDDIMMMLRMVEP